MGKKIFDECEAHESYGLLGWSRIEASNGMVLFQSPTKNRSIIAIRLSRVERSRELGHDWFFGKQNLFEAQAGLKSLMSENFSQLLECTEENDVRVN